ncbi:uncharacterized protein PHACADRAFT_206339 [Phanerochaete carnosa HHB-10118-sp]|uniref:Uncharacterized protein n=1 Tax=Phanerochaete carnosa (strain HHB-10118-sp) TaxID=650164 RepID=K5X3N5_PHACS|nr:uncharacterized protein PHACADRAFT_206339 [Phanerochaete carnosa HHB-10118-sp]EKM57412.1 hypothetical protein PHACADRAFT_206339 [Phanerochaete carnosa HHB-10118-sp]
MQLNYRIALLTLLACASSILASPANTAKSLAFDEDGDNGLLASSVSHLADIPSDGFSTHSRRVEDHSRFQRRALFNPSGKKGNSGEGSGASAPGPECYPEGRCLASS